jgi:hypothetical protein
MRLKKLIKITLLLIIAPVIANAQSSKEFKGASIAINYSSNNSKHAQGLDVDVDGKVDEKIKHSKNNNIPGIDLSYSFEVNEKFSQGIGFTYDSKKNIFLSNSDETLKGSDHYSIYLQPHYLINESFSVFAKFSYNSIKQNFIVTDLASYVNNVDGYGLGLGFKKFLNESFFVQAEINKVKYEDWNNPRFPGTMISISVTIVNSKTISLGYKF